MSFPDIDLPSNRKFGFFFAFIFAAVAAYVYTATMYSLAYTSGAVSLIFLVITTVKDDLLLPLNKLGMRFGLLIGAIISPIILGIIFFGLFTPFATVMRLGGRDELRLKFRKRKSYWIERKESINAESFYNQF